MKYILTSFLEPIKEKYPQIIENAMEEVKKLYTAEILEDISSYEKHEKENNPLVDTSYIWKFDLAEELYNSEKYLIWENISKEDIYSIINDNDIILTNHEKEKTFRRVINNGLDKDFLFLDDIIYRKFDIFYFKDSVKYLADEVYDTIKNQGLFEFYKGIISVGNLTYTKYYEACEENENENWVQALDYANEFKKMPSYIENRKDPKKYFDFDTKISIKEVFDLLNMPNYFSKDLSIENNPLMDIGDNPYENNRIPAISLSKIS